MRYALCVPWLVLLSVVVGCSEQSTSNEGSSDGAGASAEATAGPTSNSGDESSESGFSEPEDPDSWSSNVPDAPTADVVRNSFRALNDHVEVKDLTLTRAHKGLTRFGNNIAQYTVYYEATVALKEDGYLWADFEAKPLQGRTWFAMTHKHALDKYGTPLQIQDYVDGIPAPAEESWDVEGELIFVQDKLEWKFHKLTVNIADRERYDRLFEERWSARLDEAESSDDGKANWFKSTGASDQPDIPLELDREDKPVLLALLAARDDKPEFLQHAYTTSAQEVVESESSWDEELSAWREYLDFKDDHIVERLENAPIAIASNDKQESGVSGVPVAPGREAVVRRQQGRWKIDNPPTSMDQEVTQAEPVKRLLKASKNEDAQQLLDAFSTDVHSQVQGDAADIMTSYRRFMQHHSESIDEYPYTYDGDDESGVVHVHDQRFNVVKEDGKWKIK